MINSRRAVCISGHVVLFVALIWGAPASAATSPTPAVTDTPPAASVAATREQVLKVLRDVERKYGSDAVMVEGELLGLALHGNSVLAAGISVPGIENRNGKRFLIFKLDTGIIYNDRTLTPAARPVRAWHDIIETALHRMHALHLPADGIAVKLTYAHKPYADEADLITHLATDHGQPEAVAFYLLLSDITALAAKQITTQQLLDRSVVIVNGAPAHLRADAFVPTPATDTAAAAPGS